MRHQAGVGLLGNNLEHVFELDTAHGIGIGQQYRDIEIYLQPVQRLERLENDNLVGIVQEAGDDQRDLRLVDRAEIIQQVDLVNRAFDLVQLETQIR